MQILHASVPITVTALLLPAAWTVPAAAGLAAAAVPAPYAGSYVCRYDSHHMAQPRAFGTLAILADGAYTQTDVDGTTIATGTIVSVKPNRATGEADLRFSGDLKPMRASKDRSTLTAAYKSVGKLICTRAKRSS